MIRILIINASPKIKGHTSGLLEIFKREAQKRGAKIDVLFLYHEKVKPISGKLGKKFDSIPKFLKKVLDADGVVIGTPTYWFNVPGTLKNFIDQLTILEESGFLLEGKVAGFIVYAPQGGSTNVLSGLALTASHIGMVLTPYSLIFDDGRKDKWVKDDIKLLAKNMLLQIKAQKDFDIN